MTENDEKEDPFDQLAADVGEREGDPFEHLSEEDGPSMSEQDDSPESDDQPDWMPSTDTGVTSGRDDEPELGGPGEAAETGRDPGDHTRDSESVGPESDPSDIQLDVGRQATETDPLGDVGPREGDPFEEGGSLFEERDTEGIDPDAVWQDLASADSRGASGDAYERTFADVSKHSYCEQCEHFSPPPEVACTYEGADIVEFLDMETVRVVDCPVVAERRELEGQE